MGECNEKIRADLWLRRPFGFEMLEGSLSNLKIGMETKELNDGVDTQKVVFEIQRGNEIVGLFESDADQGQDAKILVCREQFGKVRVVVNKRVWSQKISNQRFEGWIVCFSSKKNAHHVSVSLRVCCELIQVVERKGAVIKTISSEHDQRSKGRDCLISLDGGCSGGTCLFDENLEQRNGIVACSRIGQGTKTSLKSKLSRLLLYDERLEEILQHIGEKSRRLRCLSNDCPLLVKQLLVFFCWFFEV